MKKTLLLAAFVGVTSLIQATTITVPGPSSLIGASALDGNSAYAVGISIPLAAGQTVISASVNFVNVTLTASGNKQGTGTLYTDLLKSSTTGVTTKTDGDAPGDYWATTSLTQTSLSGAAGKFFASVGTTLSWSYVLTSGELTALNSYLSTGTFNLGIDPDCHYSVGGLSFTYTTSSIPSSVPDAATTAVLLALGLGALEIVRRQTRMAKNNA